jgi:hypothetical protein
MQHACGIANPTGVHGHINDLLLDLRRLTGVGIFQEKRPSTPQATRTAPIPLLTFRRGAMSHNICALTVGTMQDLRYHCGSLSKSGSVPFRRPIE